MRETVRRAAERTLWCHTGDVRDRDPEQDSDPQHDNDPRDDQDSDNAPDAAGGRRGAIIVVNGEPWQVAEPVTVATVVAHHAPSSAGIAVARNRAVVPRSAWAETEVVDGDRIEIVTAAAGG